MTTATLHAHVYVESADCDGRYSRSYVMVSDAEDEWNVKRDMVVRPMKVSSTPKLNGAPMMTRT
jgi:hypothetical protein